MPEIVVETFPALLGEPSSFGAKGGIGRGQKEHAWQNSIKARFVFETQRDMCQEYTF